MTIRYIWILPALCPFVLAFLARIYWFVMGHQWVVSREGDTAIFFMGLAAGCIISFGCWVTGEDLGGFTIKLKKT